MHGETDANDADVDQIVAAMIVIGRLRDVPRRGWHLYRCSTRESVAEHTLGVVAGLLAWLTARTSSPELRMIVQAMSHDLGELITGDITPFDGVSASRKAAMDREAEALIAKQSGLAMFEGGEALEKWHESKTIKELDVIEMLVQALRIETAESLAPSTLQGFWDSVSAMDLEPMGRRAVRLLKALRQCSFGQRRMVFGLDDERASREPERMAPMSKSVVELLRTLPHGADSA